MGLAISSLKDCYNICGNKKHSVVDKPLDGDGVLNNAKSSNTPKNVDKVNIHCIEDKNVNDFIKSRIDADKTIQRFFVIDLTEVQRLYQNWKRLLPRVEVFYAVKCYPDAALIRVLAELGSSFDCASEWEHHLVMDQGIPPSKIIYANPCKQPNEIISAEKLGVQLTTFDTESELEKMSKYAPNAKALVRLRADDMTAIISLGHKFGAEIKELPSIYTKAKEFGVDVVGVCFHIGSRAKDPEALTNAIILAREAFDLGLQYGFDMSILDIGGGMSVNRLDGSLLTFEIMTEAANAAFDRYFPAESGVRIIAEPGRYLMETCVTLACKIFGVRDRSIDGVLQRDYWIPDGVHGSFCPLTVGLDRIMATPLKVSEGTDQETISSTIFGPTLNGGDIVVKGVNLPKLLVDDWLLFPNMGAYTTACASTFNGMHKNVETYHVRTGVSGSL